MQKPFLKGIAPALAVILLVAVTVGIASTAYYGINTLTQEAAEESSKPIEQQFDMMGADLKVDVFGDCEIYLRNQGTKNIPIDVISFYANEKPVNYTPSTGIIKKDAVQEINFTDLSTGRYKLLVKIYGNTMDFGWMTCTEVKCHWMNNGCGMGSCDITEMNQTCGPTGCTGGVCTEGDTQCDYDASCGGTLTANIKNPINGGSFFAGIDTISFEGNASGGSGSYTYSWDLGNGVTRTGQSFSYTYPDTDTGSRTITLTVTDSASNTATDSVTIQINSPAVLFSCFINETCNSPYTSVLALSAQDDAHAEIIGGGNYPYKLCCANVSSVQTTTGKGTCPVGFTGLITLATNSTFNKNTNAQVEKYNYTGTDGFDYKKNVCVNLTSGSLDCRYMSTAACDAWPGKIIISISNSTNAHIGNGTAYSDLVLCCEK